MYFKLLREMAMYCDRTNSLNTTVGSNTNDRNEAGSVSNHLVEATSIITARNWAWAHHSDSYDWMDWHSPFPAATPLE
ncbi:hypothetical protein OKW46_001591 [Paraburkholderia sp. WSM4179]|nr:hypothetical protein [Paraburkholderia sp. WSM4179]